MVVGELERSLLLCMSIGLFCGCNPEQSKNMATATTDAMTMPFLDSGLSETSDTSMRGLPDDSIRDLGFRWTPCPRCMTRQLQTMLVMQL